MMTWYTNHTATHFVTVTFSQGSPCEAMCRGGGGGHMTGYSLDL